MQNKKWVGVTLSRLEKEGHERLLNAAFERLPNIRSQREFSEEAIEELRSVAQTVPDHILIGTYGSYARREASTESDLDFYCICRSPDNIGEAEEAVAHLAPAMLKLVGKSPAAGGAFGKVEDLETMLSKIGGVDDHNEKITRRVLFLLEGEWLSSASLFKQSREALLRKYVRNTITSHQLALFLLNDIIRYYRTICVDFEFKTIEGDKPWGTRNIKLVFSRKLLYFSGILAVAETAQRSAEAKVQSLLHLLNMPVVERVLAVCGERAVHALELYDDFLEEFSKSEVRNALDLTKESEREHEPFRTLKDNGHHFSWRLMSLLKETYEASHPIHRALVL